MFTTLLSKGEGPWKRITAHAEPAVGRKYPGATSMEEVFINQSTNERMIRHTIFKDGEIFHETFRPYAKFGAE